MSVLDDTVFTYKKLHLSFCVLVLGMTFLSFPLGRNAYWLGFIPPVRLSSPNGVRLSIVAVDTGSLAMVASLKSSILFVASPSLILISELVGETVSNGVLVCLKKWVSF
eukprot:SAG11_NODE_2488_length_3295_cov_4.463079_1_plen_109_part_00